MPARKCERSTHSPLQLSADLSGAAATTSGDGIATVMVATAGVQAGNWVSLTEIECGVLPALLANVQTPFTDSTSTLSSVHV